MIKSVSGEEMDRTRRIWWIQLVSFAMVGLLAIGSAVVAQDESEPALAKATTTEDADVPVDQLKTMLRTLTQEELRVDLRGWLGLLRDKIREVRDTELQLEAQAEGEPAGQWKQQLVGLRTEESALSERATIVLEALKAKGGDVQTEERFIAAVSDISETADTTSYRMALVAEAMRCLQQGWLPSEPKSKEEATPPDRDERD